MTYKFQRNIPMYIPAIVLTFFSWGIFALGYGCGRLCEHAKNKKEKERQILIEKQIHRIA
jgi:hypothetical protein